MTDVLTIGQQGLISGLSTKVSVFHFMSFSLLSASVISFILESILRAQTIEAMMMHYRTGGDTSSPTWTDSHDFPEKKRFTKKIFERAKLIVVVNVTRITTSWMYFHKSSKILCSNLIVKVTKMLTEFFKYNKKTLNGWWHVTTSSVIIVNYL